MTMGEQSANRESDPVILLEETPHTPATVQDSNLRLEREPRFSDFVVSIWLMCLFMGFSIADRVEQRVFSYAQAWDFILMPVAVLASVGVGIVSALRRNCSILMCN